jgi:F-type H+-transporting ATPase subunit b
VNINLTLLGQSLTFIVFIWFCWKFIWPLLIDAMRERQKTIAEGLESAERAGKDLELAQERATEQMREAKEEAREIIEQARARATQMIEEAKGDAVEEGERVKLAAQADIEQDINRAREALRGDVAALAVAGAEKILGESIDQSRHGELLEQLSGQL